VKLAIIAIVVVVALGVIVACAGGGLPRDLREKKLDERTTAELAGVATVSVPPTFAFEGVVNSGQRRWKGGELTPLEYHLDERRLTFRFVQGQYTTLGGYRASPVILDVTFFNSSAPKVEIENVSATTIDRFYSPDNKTTLAAAAWQPEERTGDIITRSAEARDPYDDKHPRWLLIHTDGVRRVRVDLFAWRKAYTIDEARRLVRDVAASLTATAAVQRHFDELKTFDTRMEQRRDSVIAQIERDLAPCKLPALSAGSAVSSADCVAVLSANRRDVFIARYLGKVPRSAATNRSTANAPEFPIGFGPNEYRGNGSINGLPNIDIYVLWWDQRTSAWSTGKLQGYLGTEEAAPALEPHVVRHLGSRDDAHLFRSVHYDVVFNPEHVNTAEFLRDAARFDTDLASGKIVAGVRATKPGLRQP
jgi:hypothetical protein